MYIGARSCDVEPENDIGVEYFSSSHDNEFMMDQQNNKCDYAYEVIESFDCRDDANDFEIKLHREFDVGKNPLFYNRAKATSTGFCVHGMKHSPESRKKISDAAKNMSDDTRKKMSEASKGRKKSDDHRRKISEVKKWQNRSDDAKKKISDAHVGMKHSDESRKKISDTMKGKKHSNDSKKRMSECQKGVPKETGQCPHCRMVCSFAMLSRWHLDNCKLNPDKLD